MAEAHNGSEEPMIALLGNIQQQQQVVIDIGVDGKEFAAPSTQTSAPFGRSNSFYRRRHKKPLPKQDDIVEEEAPPNPLAGGSQQGDVVVDVPEEEPIPDAGRRQQGDNDDGPPPPRQVEAAGGGGLPEQALMTIIGKYSERIGQIIAFIGLGTITSTIAGLFTRGPPLLFVYLLTHQNDNDSGRDALILYYECLPAFFIVGVLEMCYGIWVSRNQAVRAGKRAKIILIFCAILLIVTVCFTGAGVNI